MPLNQSDFFQNTGGVNLTDSQFFIKDGQASGGFNYDYAITGAITKILGISKINSIANTQLNTIGIGIADSSSLATKTIIRAAGTKLQVVDPDAPSFTDKTEDTAAVNSNFLSSGSTQPVVFSNFNDGNSDKLWAAGGGMSKVYGYASWITNGEYTWVASADFVTSNSIAFVINGRSYTVAFKTSNAITLSAIATRMSEDADVGSAVSDGFTTITVTGRNGTPVAITGSIVTSGASQPTITVTTTITPSGTNVSSAKITANGVNAPTGTFSAVNQGSATGGAWGALTGIYYYALVLRKASTQSLSNAALDQTITIATATDTVLLTFPTGIDTTKYDKWYVYRSSVGGVSAFTAGTLVAKVNTVLASFTDKNTAIATSQVVPRAGSLLDNSTLPSGTYTTITSFKRHLVTSSGNTVYLADLNKSESWPLGLRINIPTGGPIKALSVIGYNSPNTGTTDEFLVVFKDRETWVINGSVTLNTTTNIWDIALLFVDSVGCSSQALIVRAGGYIAWMDSRGIYMWNGVYKPIYVSRPIEANFGPDGNLDKTRLNKGWGVFYRKKNQIIWTVSDRVKGENQLQVKLDLRLTTPAVSANIVSTVAEGVFMQDSYGTPLYAGATYLTSQNDEVFISGDSSGFVYYNYYSVSDNGSGIGFNYTTKAFDLGLPSIAKQFSKVVVWIDKSVSKDLTLKYWASYRNLTSQRSEIQQKMDDENPIQASRWDLAIWDQSLWDEFNPDFIPIVFNLNGSNGNAQGDSIMLDFSQTDASAPVTIHGFSIFWSEVALRK